MKDLIFLLGFLHQGQPIDNLVLLLSGWAVHRRGLNVKSPRAK